eukprot:4310058-Heterocapsa_arctica.AAC.1
MLAFLAEELRLPPLFHSSQQASSWIIRVADVQVPSIPLLVCRGASFPVSPPPGSGVLCLEKAGAG